MNVVKKDRSLFRTQAQLAANFDVSLQTVRAWCPAEK